MTHSDKFLAAMNEAAAGVPEQEVMLSAARALRDFILSRATEECVRGALDGSAEILRAGVRYRHYRKG